MADGGRIAALHLRVVTHFEELVCRIVGGALGLDTNVVIRAEQSRGHDRLSSGDLLLQGPGLRGTVNLLKVSNARVLLTVLTGLDEVWNRDGGQQSNDGHNNHDFNQGESGLPGHV